MRWPRAGQTESQGDVHTRRNSRSEPRHPDQCHCLGYPVALIVLAVICAAMVLTSSLGRWLLVLLAIPAIDRLLGS